MSYSPSPTVLVVESTLKPSELISGWRATDRILVLSLRDRVSRGQRMHARISLAGLGVTATITGRARNIHGHSTGAQVELEPDPSRLRALEWLVEVASGASVSYQPRAARYHASLPAVVAGPTGPVFMNTLTVSEGGCGVAWSGPTPALDQPIDIRIGAGRTAASFCAEVRWTSPAARPPAVGLQFAGGDRAAWAHLLEVLRRSGVPAS